MKRYFQTGIFDVAPFSRKHLTKFYPLSIVEPRNFFLIFRKAIWENKILEAARKLAKEQCIN